MPLCLPLEALRTPCPVSLCTSTGPVPPHHFVVDFMEVDFAHFLHDVLTLKRDKPEPYRAKVGTKTRVYGQNPAPSDTTPAFLSYRPVPES